MKATLPVRVQLTEDEQRLLDQIDFSKNPGSEKVIASGKASRELMESLEKRNAIPEIRRKYFTDPALNPNGHGKSRYDEFSPYTGGDICERPLFFKYLKYFIQGPDLPEPTMREFCRIVNEGELEGDERDLLRRFVRKEMRSFDSSRKYYFREEFYRLALECIPDDPFMPESIRKAAMEVR